MKDVGNNRSREPHAFLGWIKNVVLLLLSVSLVLVGAEVFVRYHDPQMLSFPHSRKNFSPPFFRANAKWLFELRPGTVYDHRSPYGDFRVTVRVNRNGFRSSAVKVRKPPGVFRIFIMGDSTTFGLGVENHETYPARLEAKLNEGAGEGLRFEVINGGVPGYNLAHYYLVLRDIGFRYDPDLILLGILPWNDWDLAKQDWVDGNNGLPGGLRQAMYVDAEGRVRLRGRNILRPESLRFNVLPAGVKRFLRANSHLYHFLGERLYRLRKNLNLASWVGWADAAELTADGLRKRGLSSEAIRKKLEEQSGENWRKGMRLFEAILRMAREKNIPLAVLLLPHLYESHNTVLAPKHTYFGGSSTGLHLRKWLKDRKVLNLELVQKLDPFNEKKLYLKYDKHFNAYGNELIARFLHAFLLENRLVPTGRAAAAKPERL